MYLKIHRISAPKMEPLETVDLMDDKEIEEALSIAQNFPNVESVVMMTDARSGTFATISTKDISYIELVNVPKKYQMGIDS